MTTEEKAKAYDEALERAKEMCAHPLNKSTMEYIFPELRESEDDALEFLKGHAIEWIASIEHDISQSIYEGLEGHSPEDERELAEWKKALAWLEKQKEPENTSASVMAPSCWEVEQKEHKPVEHKPADNMNPRVKISGRSYGEWEPGDTGVVDGYCRGANDIPYAIVILDKNFRFVMVEPEHLELIG